MTSLRVVAVLLLQAVSLVAATPPREWVPLRWDGGPLELVRRERVMIREAEERRIADEALKNATRVVGGWSAHYVPLNPKNGPERPLSREQEQAIRDWYQPKTLSLLDHSPYNCVLLTWSLGESAEFESAQRAAAGGYAAKLREEGLVVLAVIEPGAGWQPAVEAAAGLFDGVVLEGEFPEGAAQQALETLHRKNPDALVIPMTSWERIHRDTRFPVLAGNSGIWPGMLTPTEAQGFGAGPTSNPWVLSNGWQVGALRAGETGRAVWMAHRPNPRKPQPLELQDYLRAVADSGMAGASWVVAVGNEWRPGLFSGDKAALEEWRRLGEYVLFFQEQNRDFSEYEVSPSVLIVHDPSDQSQFDSFDILNMLAVRQIPHRVLLRPDLRPAEIEKKTKVLAFDLAPPRPPEYDTLQFFTSSGGTLVTGPRWWLEQEQEGPNFKRVIAGAGSIRTFATKEAMDSDRFSRAMRDLVDQKRAAPKMFNVGTIISLYRFDPATNRALVQMTEYGDFPTENVTIKIPRKVSRAELRAFGKEPQELKIYDGQDGGSEIDVPKVPFYCAIIVD